MVIIGLCGASGSGKGYACQAFSKYGVAFIDTDKVYREQVLTDKGCVGELTDYFGNEILENGLVSKKKLAQLVFQGQGAAERLNMLNRITHKYIKVKTDELVQSYEAKGYGAVLIDAPVLFESGFDKMCHITVCVICPQEEKIDRIIKRDGITREQAQARIASQLSDEELKNRCTYAIDNSSDSLIDGQIISILKDLGLEKN